MENIYVKYVSVLPSEDQREENKLYYLLENKRYYRGKENEPIDEDIKKISTSLTLTGKDNEGNDIDNKHIYFFTKTQKYYMTNFDKSEWLNISFQSYTQSSNTTNVGTGTGTIVVGGGGGSQYIIELDPSNPFSKILSPIDEIKTAKDRDEQLIFKVIKKENEEEIISNIVVREDQTAEIGKNGGVLLYGFEAPNKYYRILIDQQQIYEIEEKELQQKDERINMIRDEDKEKTDRYPSVKAVTEYISTHGGGGGGGTGKYSVRLFYLAPETEKYETYYSEIVDIQIKFGFQEFFGSEELNGKGKLTVKYQISGEPEVIDEQIYNVKSGENYLSINKYLESNKTTKLTLSVTGNESKESASLEYEIKAVELLAQIGDKENFEKGKKQGSFTLQLFSSTGKFKKRNVIEILKTDGTLVFRKIFKEEDSLDGPETIKPVQFIQSFDDLEENDEAIPSSAPELSSGKYIVRFYCIISESRENVWFDENKRSNIDTAFLFYQNSQDEKFDEILPLMLVENLTPQVNYGEAIKIRVLGLLPLEGRAKFKYEVFEGNKSFYTSADLDLEDELRTHDIEDYPYADNCTIKVYISGSTNLGDKSEFTFNIEIIRKEEDYPLVQVSKGLVYKFVPRGNKEEEQTFEFQDEKGRNRKIKTLFFDFNWRGNGYVTEEMNFLRLNGSAKIEIKSPFLTDSYIDNKEEVSFNSLQNFGRTFEIDLDVPLYRSEKTEVVKYIEKTPAGDKTLFAITPSYCYLALDGITPPSFYVHKEGDIKYETDFVTNEKDIPFAYLPQYQTGDGEERTRKMRISFVIEKQGKNFYYEGNNKKTTSCINIYINGECVKSVIYTPTNFNYLSSGYIEIAGTDSIVDIYEISVYQRGLNDTEIKQNYFNSFSTNKEKLALFNDNDILLSVLPNYKSNGIDYYDIDYYKAIKRFPCLLITGPLINDTTDAKAKAGIILTKPDSSLKDGYRTINWMDSTKDGYVCENKIQGTSSKEYPLRNYKFYLKEYDVTEDKINKIYYDLKTGEVVDKSTGYGESTLCWKADYMSTDHANTYNANLADELIKNCIGKDENAKDPDKKQNTIYGFRCLLFQRDDTSKEPKFYGDGALNNDKSNVRSFELETEGDLDLGNNTTKQKWEFRNNTDAICHFKSSDFFKKTGGIFSVVSALESTYPDQGDLADEGLTPNYDFLEVLFTWVAKRANFWDAATEETSGWIYNGESHKSEREYRKAIFKEEFKDHFDLQRAIFYYLFSEIIALSDNRAKNLFLRCENVKAEKIYSINGTLGLGDCRDTSVFKKDPTRTQEEIAPLDPEKINWSDSEFAKWYIDLYDLDSCYGVENVGKMTIPYFADWRFKIDGQMIFSASDSLFWNMFEEAFANEIQAFAANNLTLSNKMSLTNFKQQIKDNNSFVNVALVNRDMTRKYHDVGIYGFENLATGNFERDFSRKYLHRGTRQFQKESFLDRRYNLISSKYTTNSFANTQNSFAIRALGGKLNLSIKTNQFLYPTIGIGNSNGTDMRLWERQDLCFPNKSITIEREVNSNETGYIVGPKMITDLGDLTDSGIAQITLTTNSPLKNLLICSRISANIPEYEENEQGNNGQEENKPPDYTFDIAKLPLLEVLKLHNSKAAQLDLSYNYLLKVVHAYNCNNMTEISFPVGVSFDEVYLSGNLKSLNLSFNSINDFRIQGYNNLTRLFVQNLNTTVSTPPKLYQVYNDGTEVLQENLQWLQIADHIISKEEYNEQNEPGLKVKIRLEQINEHYESTDIFDNLISIKASQAYLSDKGEGDKRYPYISGTISFNESIQSKLDKINELYNDPYEEHPLKIDPGTIKHYVIFKIPEFDEIGQITGYPRKVVKTIKHGGQCRIPSSDELGLVSRPSYGPVDYTFTGWNIVSTGEFYDTVIQEVTSDLELEPAYEEKQVFFTVNFYNNNGDFIYNAKNVTYGGNAAFPEDKKGELKYVMTPIQPDKADEEIISDQYKFAEWSPSNKNIQKDTDCYAQYEFDSERYSQSTLFVERYLEKYSNSNMSLIPAYGFYGSNNLTEVDFENLETIGDSAFGQCYNLTKVILRNKEKICELGEKVFDETPIAGKYGSVYVPDELVGQYQNNKSWDGFKIKSINELK